MAALTCAVVTATGAAVQKPSSVTRALNALISAIDFMDRDEITCNRVRRVCISAANKCSKDQSEALAYHINNVADLWNSYRIRKTEEDCLKAVQALHPIMDMIPIDT